MEHGAQSEDVTDVEVPQSQVSDPVEALEMGKDAQQEQGSKLDIDNDPRAEGLPSNEQPSREPIVIGEPKNRLIPDAQDLQPVEHRTEESSLKTATQSEIADSPTEQDQTSKPAGGEESNTVEPTTSSSEPAIEAKIAEQTSKQTLEQTPEPEAEAKKEEEQIPEEEPLSVRLRRLMGR